MSRHGAMMGTQQWYEG